MACEIGAGEVVARRVGYRRCGLRRAMRSNSMRESPMDGFSMILWAMLWSIYMRDPDIARLSIQMAPRVMIDL